MRIAIVSGDDLVGDDPQQLCAALAARGHEMTVYVRQADRGGSQADSGFRTVPIAVGRRGASAPEVLPCVGEWAAALERLWSAHQPDVVHAYGWLGGLAGQLAARRQRIPIVQSFVGLAATSRFEAGDRTRQDSERRRVEPLLARSATWVTGECTADVHALARMRRGRTRLSILTSGVDVERYTPVGPVAARTDINRVLCVVPNSLSGNGVDIVIEALPRVPGIELVVAETDRGDRHHEEARGELKRRATALGVADRVRFAGPHADSELPMFLRSADVVACTPRQPPRAATALQAMASGVAVVAVAVGVLSDVVVDNVTGVVLGTGSPAALAAALRSLVAQRFHRESMGAAGRSRALSRYSWDRIALDSLNLYRQVAPQRLGLSGLQPTAVPR